MSPNAWSPSAALDTLKARAALLKSIRMFFAQLNVLEVETPLVGISAGTDVQLDPIGVCLNDSGRHNAWLQTSPEFAMKRLLAAGSGPIFQICKAFRLGDKGKKHNPEFTLLEWYRPGFTLPELMNEVHLLVSAFLEMPVPVTLTYRNAFLQTVNLDPFKATINDLQKTGKELTGIESVSTDRDFWLDLLFTHKVESSLPQACFLTEYPASQAALARCHIDEYGNDVALRFEFIVNGLELANGYDELTDAKEQARRFESDEKKRHAKGLPSITIDNNFLDALTSGMPSACGVAIGIDRLLMLVCDKDDISEVMSFDSSRV